jgi:dienelactone hydrolase
MSSFRDWRQVRRSAFVQDILAAFTQRSADLLPFEEARKRLGLRNRRYLGIQNVPLDHIVGSVDRYQDFTRAFCPRHQVSRERWWQIYQLATKGGGFPPIELYKVGEAYFVYDGNHRVSVARRNNARAIEAYVWEYETRASVGPDTDIDDLLCKAAYTAFLKHTNMDRLCPDTYIEPTQPDGYEDLLHEIEAFQTNLSQIDERQIPLDEAVVLWCEMQYAPIVEIIRHRDILQEFPGRTEADLYLWLRRNQEELEVRYGRRVMMEEAADDLFKRFGEKPSPARHIRKAVRRVTEGVSELGDRLVEGIVSIDDTREDDTIADALVAPVRRVAITTPPYRFQGTTVEGWETWHAEFCRRLWDLLGVGTHPRQVHGAVALDAKVEEQVRVKGLWRELIWISTEEGLRVPIYLFRPVQPESPRPAIVVFPGHGTIAQTAGLEESYHQANALELARAGFVTLTVEPRGFGRLGAVDHLQIDATARLVGRTWYGMLVQDGMHAIDYILTRREVDPARVGATGIGAGGALAMYTTILDDRISAALVSSYLSGYLATSLNKEHCPCNDIPGILRYAEMGDVAALIAPRPVMFVNGRLDPATSPKTRESFSIVSHLYRVLGVHRHARLIEPEEMGHYFDSQLAIGWFRRWLMHDQPSLTQAMP